MTMVPISIAMATYNGERYLGAQLDSLAKQTLRPFELVVCDDGSTDDTIAILKGFAAHAPFRVSVRCNETRLGFTENFLKAANLCSGEWIGFCDQDDFWLPNKLEVIASQIAAVPSLLMVMHSATCSDENLVPLGVRRPDFRSDRIVKPSTLIPNWPGFATVFRSDLLALGAGLDRPRNEYDAKGLTTHDRWVYLLANVFGEIACLSQSLALHRRHADAVTGLPKRRRGLELSAGSTVCNDARCKEIHYLELSKILSKASFSSHDNRKRAHAAAKYYARVAGLHRRRREMYEARANAFSPSCAFCAERGLRKDHHGRSPFQRFIFSTFIVFSYARVADLRRLRGASAKKFVDDSTQQ